MEDTFKGHSAHYENAVGRTDSSTEGGAIDGLIRPPARVLTPEEEKKLYRKVRLSLVLSKYSSKTDSLYEYSCRLIDASCLFSPSSTFSLSWIGQTSVTRG